MQIGHRPPHAPVRPSIATGDASTRPRDGVGVEPVAASRAPDDASPGDRAALRAAEQRRARDLLSPAWRSRVETAAAEAAAAAGLRRVIVALSALLVRRPYARRIVLTRLEATLRPTPATAPDDDTRLAHAFLEGVVEREAASVELTAEQYARPTGATYLRALLGVPTSLIVSGAAYVARDAAVARGEAATARLERRFADDPRVRRLYAELREHQGLNAPTARERGGRFLTALSRLQDVSYLDVAIHEDGRIERASRRRADGLRRREARFVRRHDAALEALRSRDAVDRALVDAAFDVAGAAIANGPARRGDLDAASDDADRRAAWLAVAAEAGARLGVDGFVRAVGAQARLERAASAYAAEYRALAEIHAARLRGERIAAEAKPVAATAGARGRTPPFDEAVRALLPRHRLLHPDGIAAERMRPMPQSLPEARRRIDVERQAFEDAPRRLRETFGNAPRRR